MSNNPDSKQEAPQSCKWCDKGDRPNFLDQDGTLVSITGEDGILCHAHEEYWWPHRLATPAEPVQPEGEQEKL